MNPSDHEDDKGQGNDDHGHGGNDEPENQGHHRGHGRGRRPDPRNEGGTWCMEDVEWDENGCLYVKNPELAALIREAIWVDKDFCITADNPDYDPTDPDGGGGGPKVNIQCPC